MRRSGVMFFGFVCFVIFGLCSCSTKDTPPVDEPPVYEGSGTAIFDGKTLDGWKLINCEATVDNGDILIVSGNGLVQTEKMYGNFVLELDWKPLADDNWDSGIYFRYDTVPEGQPWPKKYQANLLKGYEGNCSDLPRAKSKDLIKPSEWNRFKITVDGEEVTMEINGQPAWKAKGLREPAKGYIALQAEVPKGGQHRFRNIYITELPDSEPETAN